MQEKALAKEANDQHFQEETAPTAVLVEMALAKKRHRHEMAQLAAIMAEMALTAEQCRHEAAMWEKALAVKANKQRCHETDAQEKALADNTE